MAKIIVDIPDYRYRAIKDIDLTKKPYAINERSALIAIKNGTPLPKGHGDLIDVDMLREEFARKCTMECSCCVNYGEECPLLLNAPTIIEADKGEQ